jgi:nucleoside phosphorylase
MIPDVVEDITALKNRLEAYDTRLRTGGATYKPYVDLSNSLSDLLSFLGNLKEQLGSQTMHDELLALCDRVHNAASQLKPLLQPTRRKQAVPLHILVSEGEELGRLNLEQFREGWISRFGGRLVSALPDQRGLMLAWSTSVQGDDLNRRLLEIMDDAEKGELDQLAVDCGASHILELTWQDECLYQHIPELPPFEFSPRDASVREMNELAKDIDLVIMTVTQPEREAVLRFLTPLPNQQAILEGTPTNTTYRFGRFGRYRVAHVESTMGRSGRQGASNKARDVIEELKPKALLLVGIAFGVNRRTQRLGDVLVAEAVQNYDVQKVGEEKTIHRGNEVLCGNTLSERFRTRRQTWNLKCDHRKVQAHQGLMLSGDTLINNRELRDKLISAFPTAIGGEMEGAGAYDAAANKGVEVILVKGICDWADGHKNDRAQPFAAFAAAHLTEHILSRLDVLHNLGAEDVGPYVQASPDSPVSS